MQKWILSANGNIYNHAAAFAKYGYIDWKQNAKYSINDEVYIYCTKPYKRIMYKTQVITTGMTFDKITDDKEFWYDMDKYENARSGLYARLKLIEQADNTNLSLENLYKHGLNAAPQRPIKAKIELADYIDRFLNDRLSPSSLGESDITDDCHEGAKYTISVNRYERSSIARMKCIEKHGCKCIVCGMDFEKKYGVLGAGFIHIHHLVPIASIGRDYKVDYEKDLVPVCPNCHAMLHRNIDGTYLSVRKLTEIVNGQKKAEE